MRLSIIMPTIDVPVGSGQVAPTLERSVASVLNGGHDDIELLIGTDGTLPAVEALYRNEPRIQIHRFPLTQTFGNHQRHRLQQIATGDLILFMDHDDGYYPGSLRVVAEDAHFFPDRPLFFSSSDASLKASEHIRSETDMKRWVANRPDGTAIASVERDNQSHRRRVNRPAAMSIALPRINGLPLWPDTPDFWADVDFISAVWDFFEDRGVSPVYSPFPLGMRRPWGRSWASDTPE